MPLVTSVPVQPPLAVQAVALVLDQVSIEEPPESMVVGLADNATVGVGPEIFTVTVAVWLTGVPAEFVTVRVYVVVTAGETLTAVPLLAGRLPGVITPVPLSKTPVRLDVPPGFTAVGLAVKLVMTGTTGVVTVGFAHPVMATKRRLKINETREVPATRFIAPPITEANKGESSVSRTATILRSLAGFPYAA